MITGFEELTAELTDKEKNTIGPFVKRGLLAHVGKESAITGKKIGEEVKRQLNTTIQAPRLRKLIYWLQVTDQLPCLCANSNGYFVAKNEAELKENLKSLYDRIQSQTFKYQVVHKQFTDRFREND